MCVLAFVCALALVRVHTQCFSNSGESKTNYREKTQTVLGINWAQMEAGNKKERAEDTPGEKERRRRTGGPRGKKGGTRESDRARAGQGEDVMESGKKKRGEREREKREGWREDERGEGEQEDRDDVEEERRVGGERSGEFPCPVQRKWA